MSEMEIVVAFTLTALSAVSSLCTTSTALGNRSRIIRTTADVRVVSHAAALSPGNNLKD